MTLTAEDIKLGNVYAAKKPALCGSMFSPLVNDRSIIWISDFRDRVQYDSPTIKFGGKYKIVTMEQFLKWAGADVTWCMPNGEWRAALPKKEKARG